MLLLWARVVRCDVAANVENLVSVVELCNQPTKLNFMKMSLKQKSKQQLRQ